MKLRDEVRSNLQMRHFNADDINMKLYNDLIQRAASLFPNDPILNGGMIIMPDANLQSYGTLWSIGMLPPDLASTRLEARLTQLINALEVALGEPGLQSESASQASELLQKEQSPEVRLILDTLENLRKQQPEFPSLDARDFAFIHSPDLRRILEQDFLEAQRAFVAGAFKAAALLAGGLIEGMLLDKLQQPAMVAHPEYAHTTAGFPHVGSDINWDRVGLAQLVDAANNLGLLTESALRLAQGARGFRDTVHPNAELRERVRAGKEEAELLLALVKLIYRDLAG